MSDSDLPARRLIAGAVGPERRPFHKDRDEPRWFEPLHVRAPGASRSALAEAVAAGADVLVAPTWLTHRRALLPVGETRRAAAWTAAAVRVAREAVDRGMELRERAAEAAAEAAERGGSAAPALEVPRHPVLVAGVLPFLGDVAEAEAGRLAARDAGIERDLRVAVGHLAEAGTDLLLIEGGPTIAGARAAAEAAAETGLPFWVTVPVEGARVPALPGGETIEAWAAAMTHAGATGFLLVPAAGCDVPGALERLRAAGVPAERTGVLPIAAGTSGRSGAGAAAVASSGAEGTAVAESDRDLDDRRVEDHETTGAGSSATADAVSVLASRWLEAGAWHLGLADGATPERLAALRAAIDAVDGARLRARAAARDRWVALVGEAARRAPGGRAAWIGPRDAAVTLPAGFAWSELSAGELAVLPAGELRLVVAATPLPGERLAALLERGGILLARTDEPGPLVAAGLRILEVIPDPAAILARRDP